MTDDHDLVWYVAYGSNMSLARFCCYLEGGTSPGSARRNPGARDGRPATAVRPVKIPYETYFHGASRVWGGGVAFLDQESVPEAATLGRAYLITVGQFADVLAQEGRRPVGGPLDPRIRASLADGAARSLGGGWYDTVVPLDDVDGRAAVTFTASWQRTEVAESEPSAAYLAALEAGLIETWGLTAGQACDYLAGRRPGGAPTRQGGPGGPRPAQGPGQPGPGPRPRVSRQDG